MFCILFLGQAIDQDIIQIYSIKVIQVFKEYIVYKLLESSQAIRWSKLEYLWLIVPKQYIKSKKVFILRSYQLDIIKSFSNIKLSYNLIASNISYNLLDQQDQVLVLFCDYIKLLIVNTESDPSTRLLDEHDQRSPW